MTAELAFPIVSPCCRSCRFSSTWPASTSSLRPASIVAWQSVNPCLGSFPNFCLSDILFSLVLSAKNQSLWRHICDQMSRYTMMPFAHPRTQCFKETFIKMMLPFVVRCHEYPNDFLLGYDRSASQLSYLVEAIVDAGISLLPIINHVNSWFHLQHLEGDIDDDCSATYTFLFEQENCTKNKRFRVSNITAPANFENEYDLPLMPSSHIFIYHRQIRVSLTVIETGVSPVSRSARFTFPDVSMVGQRSNARCAVPRSAALLHIDERKQLMTPNRSMWPHISSSLASCKCVKLVISSDRISCIKGSYSSCREGMSRGTLLKGNICLSLLNALNVANQKLGYGSCNWFRSQIKRRHGKCSDQLFAPCIKLPNICRFLRHSQNHICFVLNRHNRIVMPCSLLRQIQFNSIFDALLEMEHFWTKERLLFYQNLRLVPGA